MSEKSEKDVVRDDEEKLEHLGEEIEQARQHLKEQQHEGERTFVDEGSEDSGDIDNTIAPPG
jgi:hypothetical protein